MVNLGRGKRIAYRRAASEALTEEVPSLRMRLAARSPHLRVRERACWAGMADEAGNYRLPVLREECKKVRVIVRTKRA